MVSTRSMTSERIFEADQTTLLLSLQRKMAEMRRKNEEVSRKNEQEIQALRRENEDMKRKLIEGGPPIVPTNLVGESITSPPTQKRSRRQRTRPPLRRWMANLVLTSRSTLPVQWILSTDTCLPIPSSEFNCQTSGKASIGTAMTTRPTQMSTWMHTPRT